MLGDQPRIDPVIEQRISARASKWREYRPIAVAVGDSGGDRHRRQVSQFRPQLGGKTLVIVGMGNLGCCCPLSF